MRFLEGTGLALMISSSEDSTDSGSEGAGLDLSAGAGLRRRTAESAIAWDFDSFGVAN
jgi:hypothetical protein